MTIREIIRVLESLAPPALQESYDNVGLLVGDAQTECTGVLVSLDVTERVIDEAVEKGCNLIVSHHPILFQGIKKLTGAHYVERVLLRAIKQDVALYAIHTNLDNVLTGVSGRMADRLGLVDRRVLEPKEGLLYQLSVYVPETHLSALESALYAAGAGNLGQYSECGYVTDGLGGFKPGADAHPHTGEIGQRHVGPEKKLEVVFQSWHKHRVLQAMHEAHPYEEIAYALHRLDNTVSQVGSGVIGRLPVPVDELVFLQTIKEVFGLQVIRHTPLLQKPVQTVALCGGSGQFLTRRAMAAGADVFITADIKYHEFFEADGRILLADIGHYESEQYTMDLLLEQLRLNFPTFALLKTSVDTNPVRIFPG